MTEDEMVGWHHQREFEQAPGVGKDREAWHAAIRDISKNQTGLRD